MRLGPIVLRLRLFKTYFGNIIGGAAELDTAISNTLTKDMAFVVPLLDDAGKNNLDSSISQIVTERFGIIIALRNDMSQADKLGFGAYDKLHDIRSEFIGALVGWIPIDAETQVCYRGGKLIDMNNGYLWYQFEFDYLSRIIQTAIGNAGFQESNFDDTEIPVDFNTVYMQMINAPDYRIPMLDKFGNPVDLPYADGFPDVSLPDMANWIDLTKNPYAGAFSRAFTSGFNVDYT
jgi:hypothetical protein